MNLIVLKKNDFIDNENVILRERRFNHLKRVNRVKKNQKLSCGLLNGKIGKGKITTISDNFLGMRVSLESDPPVPLPLTLILSLPRPKMLKRIIENITSLGVKKIYLINSWRVEKSYWQTPLLNKENLEKSMILGLEQSCDTMLPEIYQRRFFTRFVKEELPLIAKDSMCITAHPKALKKCPSSVKNRTTLVIGPEGGLIDKEIATLENIGFSSFHIGQRILKVETAVTYLLARLFT